MTSSRYILAALALSILLFIGVGAYTVFAQGTRSHGAIESIDGIPYPVVNGDTQVLEKLAHADVYLSESVFAKELALQLTFDPGNLTSLSVGVRENSFWLSYPKVTVWSQGDPVGEQTKTVYIPLTDAMQDSNQSIDLMFFAQTSQSTSEVDEGVTDSVHWELISFDASVSPSVPTIAQAKNFVRSLISRERPL